MPRWVDQSAEEISITVPRLRPDSAVERRPADGSCERENARRRQGYYPYLEELDRYERDKFAAGSRFNIRYQDALTARDLTLESVMEALGDYVDFGSS